MSLYYLGEYLRQSSWEQKPISLLLSLVTAFFSTLESSLPILPAHRQRQQQQQGNQDHRPTLPAAVKFPMKLRGDCHLSFRA